MLALLSCPTDYKGDEVISGIVTAVRRLESAGRQFFDKFERLSSSEPSETGGGVKPSSETNESPGLADYAEDEKWSAKHKTDRKNKTSGNSGTGGATGTLTRLKRLIEGRSLYEVLGINEACSGETIKKAYRRLALEYHPDKRHSKSIQEGKSTTKTVRQLGEEEATARFLLLQDAYEILSDPKTRRQYDSALPFDESIPSSSDIRAEDPHSFYEVFCPVFKRNAKWSARKPVPMLDPNAGYRDVMRFYNFWWSFESNRDFSIRDEYDTATAECREERRWMERQNQKSRKKDIQEEKARINKLVETAQSLDPVIKAQKEEEKLRKESLRNAKRLLAEAKNEEKRLAEMKKLAEAEAEKKAVTEAQRIEVEARKKAKAIVRTLRQRFREICQPAVQENLLTADEVQSVALDTVVPELELLVAELENVASIPPAVMIIVHRQCDKINLALEGGESRHENQPQTFTKPEKKINQQPRVDWSPEELHLLAKGVQKYPGGAARRWQLISTMIGTKTVEQIIDKTKEMAEGSSLKSVGSNKEAIESFMRGHGGVLKSVGAPPDMRDLSFQSEDTVVVNQQPSVLPVPQKKMVSMDWTEAQQRKLEVALKEHAPTLPPKERWAKIASDVPGKNSRECLARFKEIRQAILQSAGRPEA